MKLQVNDQVKVIAGKDKGKTGKVLRLYRTKNQIVVEKINIKTKHVKKTSQKPGEKIRFEGPMDASNVMVVCPHCAKTVRVGYKKLTTGKKQRICKKCKESIDKSTTTRKK